MSLRVTCSSICALLLLCISVSVKAQYDSSYIESYRGYVTGRILFNRKYTRMNISNEKENYSVRYSPNKTFNAGLGVSYKFATFNFSTGVYEPNPERGHTRNFDFQFHRYGRRFTFDLLFQLYKGFYVPNNKYALPGEIFYIRPDLSVNAFGGALQYLFNHRKFSYRAAFQQTELQKKSAGSFLIGLELYLGSFRGDSTILPYAVVMESGESIYRLKFIEIGPNVGYAHTFVYKKFFVTGSVQMGLNAGVNRFFDSDGVFTTSGVSPNTVIRISSGYNVRNWSINLLYHSTALHLPKLDERAIVVNAGNYRMNLIYRFWPSKRVKRMLKVIDTVDDKIRDYDNKKE